MKNKKYLLLLSVVFILAAGSKSFAHDPGNTLRYNRDMGSSSLNMMGDYVLGMMGGGMGGGSPMMRGYGGQDYGYGGLPDLINRYRNAPGPYDRQSRYNRDELKNLKSQIKEKRRELATLYRSKSADKRLIDRKIDELNRMEQRMDEMLSNRR